MSQEMQTALVAAEFVKILSQQEAEDGSHAARIVDGANHVLNFEDL